MEEIVRIFSITGGVPFYLAELDLDRTALENIIEHISRKGRLLYEEGEILLKEELREPSTYFSILESISSGNTKQAQIANRIGMPSTALPRYLSTLERLEYIEKIIPVTEFKRSKKTIYRIRDNFISFWFRFIYPNRSYIEEGDHRKFREILDTHFEKHVSFAFEGVCRDFLLEQKRKNLLPFSFTKLGTWYGYSRDETTKERKVDEIDIVGLEENAGEIIFVECKWEKLGERAAEKVLLELKEKSRYVNWKMDERKEYFGILARKIEGKNVLRKKGFLVWDMGDL